MLVFEAEGKTGVPGKKSRSRVENQQTRPTYDAESGNRTRAVLVGSECTTTAPTLLPNMADEDREGFSTRPKCDV